MGKIVFVGLCHLREKKLYLRTVHKCFIEQFLLLTMFVIFYGTAPRSSYMNVKSVTVSTFPCVVVFHPPCIFAFS